MREKGEFITPFLLGLLFAFSPTFPMFPPVLLFLRGSLWAFWDEMLAGKLREMTQSFQKVSIQGLWY